MREALFDDPVQRFDVRSFAFHAALDDTRSLMQTQIIRRVSFLPAVRFAARVVNVHAGAVSEALRKVPDAGALTDELERSN